MKIIKFALLLLISSVVHADGHKTFPFDFQSVIGTWKSDRVSVRGEKQTLIFKHTGETKFVRDMPNRDILSYSSKDHDFQMEEDIIILKYFTKEFGLTYKMVLSGWHIQESDVKASKIYGMLFLYQNGRQYNGFPVSFVRQAGLTIQKSR